MQDVCMLQNFLDGKIPPVCSDDQEQLRILLANCKKNLRQVAKTSANVEHCKDTSPVKSSFCADRVKESFSKQQTSNLILKDYAKDSGTSSSKSNDYRRRKRKHKSKKIKKRKWHSSSSSSSSSDSIRELCLVRVRRNLYAVPHYYNLHGYPIHFNAG